MSTSPSTPSSSQSQGLITRRKELHCVAGADIFSGAEIWKQYAATQAAMEGIADASCHADFVAFLLAEIKASREAVIQASCSKYVQHMMDCTVGLSPLGGCIALGNTMRAWPTGALDHRYLEEQNQLVASLQAQAQQKQPPQHACGLPGRTAAASTICSFPTAAGAAAARAPAAVSAVCRSLREVALMHINCEVTRLQQEQTALQHAALSGCLMPLAAGAAAHSSGSTPQLAESPRSAQSDPGYARFSPGPGSALGLPQQPAFKVGVMSLSNRERDHCWEGQDNEVTEIMACAERVEQQQQQQQAMMGYSEQQQEQQQGQAMMGYTEQQHQQAMMAYAEQQQQAMMGYAEQQQQQQDMDIAYCSPQADSDYVDCWGDLLIHGLPPSPSALPRR